MTTAEAVLDRLGPEDRENCARFVFSWRGVKGPILARVPGQTRPRLRFNVREARCIEGPAAAAEALVERFEHLAGEAAVKLMLEPGDCLVLDNWRVLHGRTGFAPDSPRLLKRVGVEAA